jgi:hypothetical protein
MKLEEIAALADTFDTNAAQKHALAEQAEGVEELYVRELYKQAAALHHTTAGVIRTAVAGGNLVVIDSALALALEYQATAAALEKEAIDTLTKGDTGPVSAPTFH